MLAFVLESERCIQSVIALQPNSDHLKNAQPDWFSLGSIGAANGWCFVRTTLPRIAPQAIVKESAKGGFVGRRSTHRLLLPE